MKLLCIESTDDGRLTANKVYHGEFVVLHRQSIGAGGGGGSDIFDALHNNKLRFVCYDNKGEWMTFNPKVFIPIEEI